jgi:hypothetical protein
MRAATFSIRPSCPTLTWWSSLILRMDFELKSSLKVLAEIKKTVLYQ